MENNRKEISVVKGNGKDLEISKVYDHLNVAKPKMKKDEPKDKIIIPKDSIMKKQD